MTLPDLSKYFAENNLFYEKNKNGKHLLTPEILKNIIDSKESVSYSVYYRNAKIGFKNKKGRFFFLRKPLNYLNKGVLYGENFTPLKVREGVVINEFPYEEGFKLAFNGTFESDRLQDLLRVGKCCVVPNCGVIGDRICVTLGKDGGVHIDLYDKNYVLLTIDHIIPKSKGGKNHISNYQTMCIFHNSEKGSKIEESIIIKDFNVFVNTKL